MDTGLPNDNKITGVVENVVYRNDETGFAVFDLAVSDELVTVVGEVFGISVGEEMTVWGEYGTHPSFGLQFKASAAQRILPSGATAIFRYLSGGALRGIGPVTARRIVDSFGDKTLEVIAKAPEKLTAIQGISRKKAQDISAEFKKIYGVREMITQLSAMGIETADALMLYRAYADITADILRDNPYLLCGYPLYKDFETADNLAHQMEFQADHINRIRAGIIYVLRHNQNNGHTCLPTEKLIDAVFPFLDIPRDAVEIALYDAVEDGLLKTAVIDGEERCFTADFYNAERYIAERIHLVNALEFMPAADVAENIADFERGHGIVYEALQRAAIEKALTQGAVVITGGPGTGKTTTLNAIIALCEQNGDKVALCAPTGRAAKRLSELTGKNAKTIHRLLEVELQKNDIVKFVHDESNPLSCDVVVIDEMSMVDVQLFRSLLCGIRPQCRLIMVGDFNQLPSVGPGNILHDIVDSGCCETIEFQKIFRQAAQSLIVVNAHSIVAGEMPDITARDNDFFFLQTAKEEGAKLIGSLMVERLPKAYKIDPFNDIQVLTPSRIGMMGTSALNDLLQARLNPPQTGKNEVRLLGQLYREGDRIMQIKNNYDIEWQRDNGETGKGVFNGDIGLIENISRPQQIIRVLFDDRWVNYTFEQARQLEPAYAITVHKSQGSEFDTVVLALHDFSKRLCYRNLLYTAVTRAKRMLVVVGDPSLFEAMVYNNRRMQRYTGLLAFLAKEA